MFTQLYYQMYRRNNIVFLLQKRLSYDNYVRLRKENLTLQKSTFPDKHHIKSPPTFIKLPKPH